MEDIILEWVTTIIDAMIYMLALAFLFNMLGGQFAAVTHTNKAINEKYNVYEMTKQEETVSEKSKIPLASVLYDIRELPDDIEVKIGGYTVSPEDRQAYREYGDMKNILKAVRGHEKSDYEKSYIFDREGNISGVTYTVA